MERIEEFLQERKTSNLLRALYPAELRDKGLIYFKEKKYLDFTSNDYLNLSTHPMMKEAQKKAADKFGASASASRLLSGDLKIHHELEEKIAEFKKKEAALIFNSGYQANLGIISSLYNKNDVIFLDRLSHASIVDGVKLSGARFFRFNHNDTAHLESLLKSKRKNYNDVLIITETIFSMDGDRAPLKKLVELKEKYSARLMVDEAHATGIYGKNGSGVAEEENLSKKIDIIMGTFSKALGSFGAYVVSSKKIAEYLINSCRAFIYSTALPAPVIAANLESLNLIKEEPFRRKTLLENADYFRNKLKHKGFKIKGISQIIPLITNDNNKAIDLSKKLKAKGYWALPIRPPTVPAGESRLRFSISYNHTKDVLDGLINEISSAE